MEEGREVERRLEVGGGGEGAVEKRKKWAFLKVMII